MGWTDERVELMKRLWVDGLSCAQIAKQLGGVSRNAVIGKVHRMGLSGRATPSKPARTVFKAPRAAREARPVSPAPSAPAAPRRLSAEAVMYAEPLPVRYVDDGPGLATVLTLSARMCKWPIGDPRLDGFTYCGRSAEAGPYCTEHAQVAHQPPQGKKRANATELMRSLRRYI